MSGEGYVPARAVCFPAPRTVGLLRFRSSVARTSHIEALTAEAQQPEQAQQAALLEQVWAFARQAREVLQAERERERPREMEPTPTHEPDPPSAPAKVLAPPARVPVRPPAVPTGPLAVPVPGRCPSRPSCGDLPAPRGHVAGDGRFLPPPTAAGFPAAVLPSRYCLSGIPQLGMFRVVPLEVGVDPTVTLLGLPRSGQLAEPGRAFLQRVRHVLYAYRRLIDY